MVTNVLLRTVSNTSNNFVHAVCMNCRVLRRRRISKLYSFIYFNKLYEFLNNHYMDGEDVCPGDREGQEWRQ